MIGKVIQEKRKEAGYTQAQLADLLGVSAPAVNRWEKDLSYPDANLLAPLARLLKTDLNSLFSFYDSLTDKERELAVDKAREMLLSASEDDALGYIDTVLRHNLSDGILFQEMAGMLHGIHFFRQSSEPHIYLDRVASYYERALELLPEKTDSIAYSLMTVYAELDNYEKAEEALAKIRDVRTDKKWAHAELLYAVKRYDEAIPALKEEILKKAVSLSSNLDLLRDAYKKSGNTDCGVQANEKSTQLRALFGLWSGFDVMSDLTSAISSEDPDTEHSRLVDFVSLDTKDEHFSNDPLFVDVTLGGAAKEECTTADLMADILAVLKSKH